jgi:hypothetical protein
MTSPPAAGKPASVHLGPREGDEANIPEMMLFDS